MIDCVHNFTSDCLTIDVVPVLFELKAHVEGKLSDCDLVIPRQNMDPFYPIGNLKPCTKQKKCIVTYA